MPKGDFQTCKSLRNVLEYTAAQYEENRYTLDSVIIPQKQRKLIIVMTDNVPTDGSLEEVKQLLKVKAYLKNNVHVSFQMCNEDKGLAGTYRSQIRSRIFRRVDTNDDYVSKDESKHHRYALRTLLGSVNRKYECTSTKGRGLGCGGQLCLFGGDTLG